MLSSALRIPVVYKISPQLNLTSRDIACTECNRQYLKNLKGLSALLWTITQRKFEKSDSKSILEALYSNAKYTCSKNLL